MDEVVAASLASPGCLLNVNGSEVAAIDEEKEQAGEDSTDGCDAMAGAQSGGRRFLVVTRSPTGFPSLVRINAFGESR